MTFDELRKKYTDNELSYFPGDANLRREAFTPVLTDLYENKIVYYEKFICVVALSEIELTEDGFRAKCTPEIPIMREGYPGPSSPTEQWKFGGKWDWMRLINNSINVPYAGWSIWPEKERVRQVIELASRGDFDGALRLTLYEPEVDDADNGDEPVPDP